MRSPSGARPSSRNARRSASPASRSSTAPSSPSSSRSRSARRSSTLLNANAIDCGNLFSTDAAITENDLTALEDDMNIVPNEAVLPLISVEKADAPR